MRTYSISFNPVRSLWLVWKTIGNTSTVVKSFKTEGAAKRWVEKR